MDKQYGGSVLEYIKDNSDVVADPELEFKDLLSEKEVELEREALKQYSDKSRKDIVTTDAINGIKSSSKEEFDPQTLEEIINERDIKGKTLTQGAISLLEDLFKESPTEEELEHISKFFDKVASESKKFSDLSIGELEEGLGDHVCERIYKLVDDKRYFSVLARFAEQLNASYTYEVEYNDDLRELVKISKLINKKKETLNDTKELDAELLSETGEDFIKILNKLKNLSDRDNRMRATYTVDDIENELMNNVKNCLEESLSFNLIKEKHINNKKKYRKDMKNIDKVNNSIENWISDIKNDPETIYTLPINGYLSISESREAFIKYLYDSYIMLKFGIEKLSSDSVIDIEKDYVGNGVCTLEELKNIKLTIIYFVYLLTKAFKYKKIDTPDKRRILSYTLDILSKLGKSEYQKIFVDIISFINE